MRFGFIFGVSALLSVVAAANAGDAPSGDPQRLVLEALRRGDDPAAQLADLRQQHQNSKSLAAVPASGLDECLTRLAALLSDSKAERDARLALIDAALGELALADARFSRDAERAKQAGVSATARQRLTGARQQFDAMLGGLNRSLAAYATTLRTGSENASQRSALLRQLAASTRSVTHAVLGTNGLAVARPGFAPRALPARIAASPSFADSAAAAPITADATTSADAPLSAAVLAKARSLGFEYHRIHDFVRSSIRTEWYAGAQKGPDETLRSGAGNDVDQASLLIALLRASSASARYVKLVEELPVERLAPMLGVHAATDVGRALTAAGIPNQAVIRGGQVVSYQFEHTVVSAYLPYGNYRGTSVDTGGKAWIPLDPSLKPYALRDASGVLPKAGVSASAFIGEWTATPQTGLPLDLLRQRASNWLANQPEHPTLDSQTQLAVPDAPPLGLVPNSLPGTSAGLVYESATLPEIDQQAVHVVLRNAANAIVLDRRLPLPAVIGKRLTLSYLPATKEDQDTVLRMGGIAQVPAYLVKLRARLSLGGEPDQSATADAAPGDVDRLELTIESPAGTVTTTQQVGVGGYVAIVAGTQASGIPAPPENDIEPLDSEFLAARLLANVGLRYNAAWDRDENDLAALVGVSPIRPLPALSLVLLNNQVQSTLGLPQRLEFKGVNLDASLRPIEPIAGDRNREADFLRLNGLLGSAREHWVFENDWSVESISADKGLALAAGQSIPRVTQTGGTLPASVDLPADTVAGINAQLAQGWRVDLATRELAVQSWHGAVWHAEDPATGASGWYIAGRYAGGATVQPTETWLLRYLAEAFGDPASPPPNEDPDAAFYVDGVSTTDFQIGTVDQELDLPVAVLVSDRNYRPVQGAHVHFAVKFGQGSLAKIGQSFGPDEAPITEVTVDTDRFGVARIRAKHRQHISFGFLIYEHADDPTLKPQYAGQVTIGVDVTGNRVPSASLATLQAPMRFYAHAGPAARLTTQYANLSTNWPAGIPIGPWRVRAEDQFGNVVSNAPVTFSSTTGDRSDCTAHGGTRGASFYEPGVCPARPLPTADSTCATDTLVVRSSPLDTDVVWVISGNRRGSVDHLQASSGQAAPVTFDATVACDSGIELAVEDYYIGEHGGMIEAAQPNAPLGYKRFLTLFVDPHNDGHYVVGDSVNGNPQQNSVEVTGDLGAGLGVIAPTVKEQPGIYSTTYTGGPAAAYTSIYINTAPPFGLPNTGFYTIEFGIDGVTPASVALNARSYPTEDLQFPIHWRRPPQEPRRGNHYEIKPSILIERDGQPWLEWGAPYSPDFEQDNGSTIIKIPPIYPFDPARHRYSARLAMHYRSPARLVSDAIPLNFGQLIILGVDLLTSQDRTPGEQGVAGRFPTHLRMQSRLDVPNGRLCQAGDRLYYTLFSASHVTISAYALDGNGAVSGPEIRLRESDDPEGTSHLDLEPSSLPFGEYRLVVSAETIDGHHGEFAVPLSNTSDRDDTVPLAHAFVKGVDLRDGHLTVARDDIAIGGRGPGLHLTRYYSSLGPRVGPSGQFGTGWSSNLDTRVVETDCQEWLVIGADGGAQRFVFDAEDAKHLRHYRPLAGYHGSLIQDQDGYDYYSKDGTHYRFRLIQNSYMLTRVEDPDGNGVDYTYGTEFSVRVVREMRDSAGRSISLTYETVASPSGIAVVVKSAQGPAGLQVDYTYDDRGMLAAATRQGAGACAPTRCEAYHYKDLGNTTITDVVARGAITTVYAFGYGLSDITQVADGSATKFDYDNASFKISVDRSGQAVSLTLPGVRVKALTEADNGAWNFEYSGIHVGDGVSTTVVKDARGKPTSYTMNHYGAAEKVVSPAGTTLTEWDFVHYQPHIVTDALGTTTTYTYDASGNRTGELVASPFGSIQRSWSYYSEDDFEVPIKNRVKTASDARHIVDGYGYDTRGHVKSHTRGGKSEGFGYGSNGDPETHTDYNQHVWRSTFDEFGYVESRLDPLGHVSREKHDARGRLRSETDANTNTTTHDYDAADRRVATTLPKVAGLSSQLHFDYNDAARTLDETDENNHHTVTEFDPMGRVVKITNARNNSKEMRWDGNGNRTYETDFRGNATTFGYDDANRLETKSEPEGRNTTFGYDALGHLTSETISGSGAPRITLYEYAHPLYFKTKTTRKGGSGGDWIESRVVDGNGNSTTITDPNGHATTQEFDDFDRVTDIHAPMGRDTKIGYDNVGNKTSETLGRRNRTWDYDDANRMFKATDGTGAAVITEYYPNGAVFSRKDGRGGKTTYTIDARNRVTDIEGPIGEKTHRDYDGKQNVTLERLPIGNSIVHTYDELDRLDHSTDSVGNIVKFKYDADGHPTSQFDGLDHESTFEYDGLGHRKTATLRMSRSRAWTYDVHGDVLTEKDGRGNITTHDYDGLGQRTKTTLPANFGSRQWTYDAAGNLVTSTDSNGHVTRFEYDAANRRKLRSISAGDKGSDEAFDYNVLDQMTSHRDRRGITEVMTYDLEGRQQTLTRGSLLRFERTFDANGNLETDKDGNGHLTLYTYDLSNHRTSADHAGEIETWDYDDKTAFATSHTDGAHHRTEMVPDLRERLHSETNAAGETTTYEYDANNNRTKITPPLHFTRLVYDDANRLSELISPIGENVYTYTKDDQLETIKDGNGHTITLGIDELGRVKSRQYPSSGAFTMTYDGEGNLKSETHPNGVSVDRRYDPLNREISATYAGSASGSVVVTHSYDGNGNVESVTEQSGGHSVVIERTYNDQSWLKSEDVTSDANPTPLATSKYFASLAVERGKSAGRAALSEEDQQGIGFTGYQKEAVAGLYYAGARYYDPLLGRFDSLDPVHGDPAIAISFNPYVYARDNPGAFVDPSGRDSYNAELRLLDRLATTNSPNEEAEIRQSLKVMSIEQSARLGATGEYASNMAAGVASFLATVVGAEVEASSYGLLGNENLSAINNGVDRLAQAVSHPIDRVYTPWAEKRARAEQMKASGDIYGGEYLKHTTTLEAIDTATAVVGLAGAVKSFGTSIIRRFARDGLAAGNASLTNAERLARRRAELSPDNDFGPSFAYAEGAPEFAVESSSEIGTPVPSAGTNSLVRLSDVRKLRDMGMSKSGRRAVYQGFDLALGLARTPDDVSALSTFARSTESRPYYVHKGSDINMFEHPSPADFDYGRLEGNIIFLMNRANKINFNMTGLAESVEDFPAVLEKGSMGSNQHWNVDGLMYGNITNWEYYQAMTNPAFRSKLARWLDGKIVEGD